MPAIQIKNLKKYFGRVKALDGVNFEIQKGEIFGFLGPNGAGKTTAIRCMMDFIRPNFGWIKILGWDARRHSVELKNKIGYLSSDTNYYNDWTGWDHINFVSKIRGQAGLARQLIQRLDFNPRT